MEQPNWWILLVAALIPLVVGSLWYSPKVFGNAWMKSADINEKKAKSGNMIKIFGLTYLFSLLGAYMLSCLSVHQSSMFQLFFGDPAMADASSQIMKDITAFMETYGHRHRTFGHGVIHGVEAAIFMGLPLFGIIALFERRPAKYTLIHLGFYALCFGLMGGVICAYF